jgi:soluble cytochrome b562
MRTFRTIGIVGVVAAILLSSAVAFAEEGQTGILGKNGGDGNRPNLVASTTQGQSGEDMNVRLQNARASAQARILVKREEISKHLADIKDKAKQQLVQSLAGQFENFNNTWTDHLVKVLDSYDAILGKIQDRAAIAANNGKDISSTTAAIQSAKTAIAAARAAVVAQAAKTYTLDTTSLPATATSTSSGQEKLIQGLRKSFQSLHTTLFKDLFALRDGPMKAARKAVDKALQTLKGVRGVDGEESATTTGQSNQ